MFLLAGQRQVAFIGILQLGPAARRIGLDQSHQAERAQPVLHRRLTPFVGEDLRIGKHAVEVVDRGHVMLVILVIGLRAAHPPQRQALGGDRPTEIGIFAAIADIARVEPAHLLEGPGRKREIERPEATVITAAPDHVARRPGPVGVFDGKPFERFVIDA